MYRQVIVATLLASLVFSLLSAGESDKWKWCVNKGVQWYNYSYHRGRNLSHSCERGLHGAHNKCVEIKYNDLPVEVQKHPMFNNTKPILIFSNWIGQCPLNPNGHQFAFWSFKPVHMNFDNRGLKNLTEICRSIDAEFKVTTYDIWRRFFPGTLFNDTWSNALLAVERNGKLACFEKSTGEEVKCKEMTTLVCQKLSQSWFPCGGHEYIAAKGNFSFENGTKMCDLVSATRLELKSCSEVECFKTFLTNPTKNLEKVPIQYTGPESSAFKLPPKDYEGGYQVYVDRIQLKWIAEPKNKTRPLVCRRIAKNSTGPNPENYAPPTYCKNKTTLSELLTSDVRSGSLSQLETHLQNISFNFPKITLYGLVQAVVVNQNTTEFVETMRQGIRTDRAVVSDVSRPVNTSRVSLSVAQAHLLARWTKNWTEETELDPKSGALLLNSVADEDYLLIDVHDPEAEEKVRAGAKFSIRPTSILNSKVLPAILEAAKGGNYYVVDANYSCVYLDQTGDNSTMRLKPTGCSSRTAAQGGYLHCVCNHTSVFTALLSVRAVVVPALVKYLSYAAQGLTVLFLLVTAGALFAVRQAVNNDRTFVQINLCLALVFLHVTSVFHDLLLLNSLVCEIGTVALHFFLLSSGFWMLLEGITLAIKTSKLAIRYSQLSRRTMNAQRVIVGWFIPAAITATAAGYGFASDSYMEVLPIYRFAGNGSTALKYNRCWVDQSSHIYWWGVVGPMAFAVLVNLVILVRVFVLIYTLDRNQPVPPVPGGRKVMNVQRVVQPTELINAFMAVLFLSPVVGVPWILPFFVGITPASTVALLYLNLAINGLQGILLFLVYCVRGEEVRKALGRQMEKSGISLSLSHSRGHYTVQGTT